MCSGSRAEHLEEAQPALYCWELLPTLTARRNAVEGVVSGGLGFALDLVNVICCTNFKQ
jgi:hypothetical protein